MLLLTQETKIHIFTKPVDFRKQIDGLTYICKNYFLREPKDGNYYVFINKSRTMIKILSYDTNGYWLSLKRLSKGKYNYWPSSPKDVNGILSHKLRQILNNLVATK